MNQIHLLEIIKFEILTGPQILMFIEKTGIDIKLRVKRLLNQKMRKIDLKTLTMHPLMLMLLTIQLQKLEESQ